MRKKSLFKIRQAVQRLNQGQVIAYPTEAVYGLGCNPLDEEAVTNLLVLKQRPVEKGLILIAASPTQLEPFLVLNTEILSRIEKTWPGAITWVIPAQPWVPKWLTGDHHSLAVRVTAHPVAKQLCQDYQGALVSTSANMGTRPPATKAWMVRQIFSAKNVYIVSGEVGGAGQVSPIFDALTYNQLR